MEGPSLRILREELLPFLKQKVLEVTGNTKQPKETLLGSTLTTIDTWGKVLFLIFRPPRRSAKPLVTKTHFLMFGSYSLNTPKPGRSPRLEIQFANGTMYFYSCSIRFAADDTYRHIDRGVDLMADEWDLQHVISLMKPHRQKPLCDLLLDQSVFAGSGNIVKNEVLFNIRRHPLTPLARIPSSDWSALAEAVHDYCWNFYRWKKTFELRRHWQVYRQNRCPLCEGPLKRAKLGKFLRRTFFCPTHQRLPTRQKHLTVFPVLPVKKPHRPEPALDH